MQKSSIVSMLAAAASIMGLGSPGLPSTRGFHIPRIRFSKRYPEQSTRQAARAHRRQQGGPGIVLNDRHQYVPCA